jgi:hypothetical protein
LENCPASTLFPGKGCPAYRSSPVQAIASGNNPEAPALHLNSITSDYACEYENSLAKPHEEEENTSFQPHQAD